jgi:DNA uptake protein ComE-like DNA-binding protein
VKIKDVVEEYFVFSKRERWGIYILSFITLMVWAIPFFFATDDSIEDVLQITYVQIDSAREQLIKRQSVYKNTEQANWKAQTQVNKNQHASGIIPKRIMVLDINEADSVDLERLPAIGEKLSSRIVRYRDRLGGFLQLSQLKEVYGLSDSTYQIIVPLLKIGKDFKPKQIDINKAEYTDLRKHPYTNNSFIKLVLAYRKVHGNFSNQVDLQKVEQLDKLVLDKLAPYLSYGH